MWHCIGTQRETAAKAPFHRRSSGRLDTITCDTHRYFGFVTASGEHSADGAGNAAGRSRGSWRAWTAAMLMSLLALGTADGGNSSDARQPTQEYRHRGNSSGKAPTP